MIDGPTFVTSVIVTAAFITYIKQTGLSWKLLFFLMVSVPVFLFVGVSLLASGEFQHFSLSLGVIIGGLAGLLLT